MKTKNFSQFLCLLLILCFITISCEQTEMEEEVTVITYSNMASHDDGDRGGGGGGAQAN